MKHIGKRSGIYTITNKVDGKIYVGYATVMYTRCIEHRSSLRNDMHGNPHLQHSWNLYGEKSFLFEELVECPVEHLISEENYWCNLLDVHNDKYGYNIATTGQKGQVKANPSSIIKRQQTRRKNAEKRGYWVSEEYIEKKKREMKGKPVHPNMIIKSIEKSSKKTTQYTKDGKIVGIYKSQCEAARITGINDRGINNACMGKISTSGGYVWRSGEDSFEKYPVIINKPIPAKGISASRPIIQYSKTGVLIKEYLSLSDANRQTGISTQVMKIQADGKMKTLNGNVKYIWKWKK